MNKELKDKRKKVIYDLVKDSLYVPMKEKELAILLQVKTEDRDALSEILNELVIEGKISLTEKGKYIKGSSKKKKAASENNKEPSNKEDLKKKAGIIGTFISNAKGFGFVCVDGEEEDYYIPADQTLNAMHKDKVEIVLLHDSNGKRKEAKIVKIVERDKSPIIGTFEKLKNFGFVRPDNAKFASDIFIPNERSKGAVTGHKVVVEITDYGSSGKNPEGKIVEIIGHINDPGVDISSIVKGYDLPVAFSEKVMNQVERVSKEVSEQDYKYRRDLRTVKMVTIDGEDAKDLDDAVSLTFDETKQIYHLGVHIADVSNYVQEYSSLDKEALNRGTSVYLVDRVIPMLPHALSNGICSLNQGEDRLALSCLMDINTDGDIVNHEIIETVINVNQRMSYTSVKKVIEDNDTEEQKKYQDLVPMFFMMKELSKALREKRTKRGAIDFDFPESKIILDKDGHPTDIMPYERNSANMLIEDFMLAANETVAQHFYWMEIPFVYRIHETPDAEKIQKLNLFIRNLGYSMKKTSKSKSKVSTEEIHPKEIQKLLSKVEGTKEEAMVARLTLRSMKQAKYSMECAGHFGLASPFYCHFTSPIRRYPDLQIHRIIKEQLHGKLSEQRLEHYKDILAEVAKHSSDTERRAEEAERETDKLKKVEYMQDKLGELFEGVISGVTSWGIYVELPNTVEGLIHVAKLPGDYYIYNESNCEMVGEKTGRTFTLGQTVKVCVASCDLFTKTIDFDLTEE